MHTVLVFFRPLLILRLAARNEIERTVLDLFEDTADIFSHDAKDHQLHAAEEKDTGRDRSPAGYCIVLNVLGKQYMQKQEKTEYTTEYTAIQSQPQRNGRIRQNTIQRKIDHLAR